jgi:hypothetical protein
MSAMAPSETVYVLFFYPLTFRRWHLNCPHRSVWLGIKCPSHVRNATCQKKIISLSFFKLEPSNKNTLFRMNPFICSRFFT